MLGLVILTAFYLKALYFENKSVSRATKGETMRNVLGPWRIFQLYEKHDSID